MVQTNQKQSLNKFRYNCISGKKFENTNNNFLISNNLNNNNFYNYNNNISTNINNYINPMNNDNIFSLSKNINNNNINLIQYTHNNLNNFNIIQNLNPINNLNGINNINQNEINNINNNINFGSNLNTFNSLKDFNNINIVKPQINNNINSINIIHNNFIENNYNTNNLIGNKFTNFYNYNISNNDNFKSSQNNEDTNINLNSQDKICEEEFLNFVKGLSMPLVEYLCTPKGTLDIQKKLGKTNSNRNKILLITLLNKKGLPIIMKNTYGNYFFQQLIKGTEEIIISLIISYISEEFVEISKDPSGTFSIQALLNEVSSLKEEKNILNIIRNHEMEMAFHKNATYVLQKIVLLFPDIHRSYLNEIILRNFKDLCMDPNGICLIKNFIKTNTLVNNKIRINDEISKNFVVLAESPFGNYGIQYLMENWNKKELNGIKEKISENIYKLSIQQFSSNVVEKAIEIFDAETKEKMIKKLCFEGNFIILLKNKFGRFVLNKAINYMNIHLKNEFEIYLINNINNKVYTHKDKNKVKKFVMKIKNNKLQTDIGLNLNKEIFVKNNFSSNLYNYNLDYKNNNNNFKKIPNFYK